jgi:flagellar motor switch protein FliM
MRSFGAVLTKRHFHFLYHQMTPSPTAQTHRPAALDPRSLGRPVHLLPQVAQRLREALQRLLVQPWNRRYHSRYELQALTLRPLPDASRDAGDALRWLRAAGPAGLLACRIDRPLVLALMARRLGLGADTALATADTPPTATEDRLLHLLAGQFASLCVSWLAQASRPDGDARQDLPLENDLPPLQGGTLPAFGPDGWELVASLRDGDQEAAISLALAGAYLLPLLRQLSAQHRPSRPPAQQQALDHRLALTLQARLLERALDLGAVLDLRPGALIPIRLADATVMVEGSPLMSAAVAEHQGKLCLTSFQDLE